MRDAIKNAIDAYARCAEMSREGTEAWVDGPFPADPIIDVREE
jgi:hypothetical protein